MDSEEIGKQVAKRTRKRPDRSLAQSVVTKPGDNRKYIKHSLRLADFPVVNIEDPEEVAQRIIDYFQICADDDMKPSVAGLSLAMGIDRRRLWEIREGRMLKNPDVSDALKRAMQILDLQMTDYMQNGQINPVSGIFLMKNNFGYADRQDVVVTPNNPLGEMKDAAAIEARYVESVEDDTEDGE